MIGLRVLCAEETWESARWRAIKKIDAWNAAMRIEFPSRVDGTEIPDEVWEDFSLRQKLSFFSTQQLIP